MWPPNRGRRAGIAALLLAPALAAAQVAGPSTLTARPPAPLPDVALLAVERDAACRVTVRLANRGSAALPASAYRRPGVTLTLRGADGAERRLHLGRIDPRRRLQPMGGTLDFTLGDDFPGAAPLTSVVWDREGRLKEADETNDRWRGKRPCRRPPPDTSRDDRDPATGGTAPPPATRIPESPAAPETPPAPPRPLPASGGSALDAPLPPPPEALPPLPATDDDMEPGEIVALARDMAEAREQEARARELGLRIKRRVRLPALGMVVSVFRLPAGEAAAELIRQWREGLPEGQRWQIEANHRYRLMGARADPRRYGQRLTGWKAAPGCGAGLSLGLVDTALARDHPALAGADIRARRFVVRGVDEAPAHHATALAALLVGDPGGEVAGLLPGARLRVASVFRQRDGEPETTAEWLLQAIDWLLAERVTVIQLSLGGPRNLLLEAALKRALAQGAAVVAAAGNGGPGAAAVYPAAQPGVVAVSAMDADLKPWKRANRGDYIDFTAPGVDIWSPRADGGYAYRSGSSYAVPFVGAALALAGGGVETLRRQARDLGPPGRDPVFGWGLVQAPAPCATGAETDGR